MTLFLVEGPDRAGKTTECRRLMAQSRTRPRVMLHFVAPPPGLDALVLQEMAIAYNLARTLSGVDFVLDRGHVSWFTYATLRGIKAPWAMAEWERAHVPHGSVLVRCEAPAGVLAERDDGASTFTRPSRSETLERAQVEASLFAGFMDASTMLSRRAGWL